MVVRKADTRRTGTAASFTMVRASVPTSFSGSPRVMERFKRFDPLADNVLNITEGVIEEEVVQFGAYSDIPVFFNDTPVSPQSQRFDIVDTGNGLEYNIAFALSGGRCEWLYRGRSFKSGLHFPMIGIIGNIRSGKADNYLSPSREEAHHDGRQKIIELFHQSVADRKDEILKHAENKELAHLYYLVFGTDEPDCSDAVETWRNATLSGQILDDLIQVGTTVYLVDAPTTDTIDPTQYGLEDLPVIYPHEGGAEVFVQVLDKLDMGVRILEYRSIDIPDRFYPDKRSKVRLYKMAVVATSSESLMDDQAIKDISDAKLARFNTRYFIPCGTDQYPEISIPTSNVPAWVTPLCRYPFPFPRVIVLRSTRRALEEDEETLIEMIIERNDQEFSPSQVRQALDDFYGKYEFDAPAGHGES